MRIRCSNLATTKLYDSAIMDKPVYFKNGKAQVSDEVGRALAAKYSAIEVVETKRKKPKTSTITVKGATLIDPSKASTSTVTKLDDEQISLTKDKPQEGDTE